MKENPCFSLPIQVSSSRKSKFAAASNNHMNLFPYNQNFVGDPKYFPENCTNKPFIWFPYATCGCFVDAVINVDRKMSSLTQFQDQTDALLVCLKHYSALISFLHLLSYPQQSSPTLD